MEDIGRSNVEAGVRSKGNAQECRGDVRTAFLRTGLVFGVGGGLLLSSWREDRLSR